VIQLRVFATAFLKTQETPLKVTPHAWLRYNLHGMAQRLDRLAQEQKILYRPSYAEPLL